MKAEKRTSWKPIQGRGSNRTGGAFRAQPDGSRRRATSVCSLLQRLFLGVAFVLVASAANAASFVITSTADSGAGSLRQGIIATPAGGTIEFNIPATQPGYNSTTGIFTITLTSGELQIGRDLAIVGPTNAKVAISGNNVSRVFNVLAGTVTISNVTVTKGAAVGTAGMNAANNGGSPTPATPGGPAEGGGVFNQGNLTLRNCTVSGNEARGGQGGGSDTTQSLTAGAGGGSAAAGGISNRGVLTLINCTLSGNLATGGSAGTTAGQGTGASGGSATGAGLFTIGPVTVTNSTFSGNVVTGGRGGTGTETVSGGAGGNGSGGGLALSGPSASAMVLNTIVAGNTAVGGTGGMNPNGYPSGANGTATAPDVAGAVASQGHNLVGRTDGNSGWNSTDFLGGTTNGTRLDPLLSPLQDNGGPTFTQRPVAGSAAIDHGDDVVLNPPFGLTTDQRGYPRGIGMHVDIGSVEVGVVQSGPTFTVTNTATHDDGSCSTDDCTLREALNAANANADANTILFASGVTGSISVPGSFLGYAISNPLTVQGPGARLLAINGESRARAFEVSSANVVISGLTMSAGFSAFNGGNIYNTGNLTLQECTVADGFATSTAGPDVGLGGGVYNAASATLTLNRCTFRNNTALLYGGGVYTEGACNATNCTFTANTALRGGGVILRGSASISLRNCTITNNSATDGSSSPGFGGGGLFCEGGAAQHLIANCIVAGNSATNDPDARGNYTSQGHNLIGIVDDATGFGANGDQLGVNAQLQSFGNHGGPIDTWSLLSNSPAINAGDNSLAPATDQRGYGRTGTSDIGAYEFKGLLPATLANISTRLRVETGDNVLIGGFIVTGTEQKKIMLRAIGPSLSQFFSDTLSDPILELRDGTGALIESNDNWIGSPNKQAIIDSGIAPSNDFESAIIATLPANGAGYTAIVRGVNGATGIGVVEAYDLDRTVDSKLANISTRGFVQTGNNVLIAGTIVLGTQSQKVIIRAIGPSLPLAGRLENPTLELRDGNGVLLEANDNWVESANKEAIVGSTIPPGNDLECAIVRTLAPAAYTAIVRGVNGTTGVAVVEVYALP